MGRPEFENQTSISATTSKTMKYIEGSIATPLLTGDYEKVTIYSPPNTISRVMHIGMEMPIIPGQTTGQRILALDANVGGKGVNIFYGYANGTYAEKLLFANSRYRTSTDFTGANCFSMPGQEALPALVREIYFDDIIGITFAFRHTSGITVTGPRLYSMFVMEEAVKR